jgi:hypothetical protein
MRGDRNRSETGLSRSTVDQHVGCDPEILKKAQEEE